MRCECGNELTLRKTDFNYKWSKFKSCGCLKKEVDRDRMLTRNAEHNPVPKGDKHWTRIRQVDFPHDSVTGQFIKRS